VTVRLLDKVYQTGRKYAVDFNTVHDKKFKLLKYKV
jgi:hypothetical protein